MRSQGARLRGHDAVHEQVDSALQVKTPGGREARSKYNQ